MSDLVLSLFPGIGLLDSEFERAGFCVVRGPDVLWGGDIRAFHPPAGVFDLVIGGPPCQTFSSLAHLVRTRGYEPKFGNLIPEFERCVAEAQPRAFLMENVPAAPLPVVDGYIVRDLLFNNRWAPEAPEQNRVRRFSFGTRDGRALIVETCALLAPTRYLMVNGEPCVSLNASVTAKGSLLSQHENARVERAQNRAVTAAHSDQKTATPAVLSGGRQTPVAYGGSGKLKATVVAAGDSSDGSGRVKQVRYSLADACELQGLPRDFLADAPFTAAGKLKAVANGVPLPMGRAIARAVRRALAMEVNHA